jgi:hypothetical protein
VCLTDEAGEVPVFGQVTVLAIILDQPAVAAWCIARIKQEGREALGPRAAFGD